MSTPGAFQSVFRTDPHEDTASGATGGRPIALSSAARSRRQRQKPGYLDKEKETARRRRQREKAQKEALQKEVARLRHAQRAALEGSVALRVICEIRDSINETQLRELKNKGPDKKKTYGELQAPFFQTILEERQLGPLSTFVDLGCGIGNLLVQATVYSGCDAFGIELRQELKSTADSLRDRALEVCKIRGISMGRIAMEWGDMLKSKAVEEWMRRADLVVVNNKVFEPTLNLHILDEFLPLMKHGACIISTELFISGRQTRHAIYKVVKAGFLTYTFPDQRMLEVTVRKYPEKSMSWTDSSSEYYIHRVHDPATARDRQEQLGQVYHAPGLVGGTAS